MAIMVVRFGRINTIDEKYKEWKTSFIVESSISFPDVMFYTAQPNALNSTPACTQLNAPGNYIFPQRVPCPSYPNLNCLLFPFHQHQSSGIDAWPYTIQCTFLFNPSSPTTNNELMFATKGGFATLQDNWAKDWTPLRPNAFISVHLEPLVFLQFAQPPVHFWTAHPYYETTEFPPLTSGSSFNTTIFFRIPYPAILTLWETIGLSSWGFMAVVGGTFFFFYFLHCCAFAIAKFFLPHDSKLLSTGTFNREFQPIKG